MMSDGLNNVFDVTELNGVSDQEAAYGISAGGYLPPRVVALEKRIKACVACSIILDFSAIMPSNISTLEHSFLFRVMKILQPWKLQAALNLLDTYRWHWGADTLAQLCDMLRTYKLDLSLITCPTLNLVAGQEYANFEAGRLWANECLDKIANPKNQLIVAPQSEGTGSHAAETNLSLMSQIVFDWLDDVLQPESQFSLKASPVPV